MKLALGLLMALSACQAPTIHHPATLPDAADSTYKIEASIDGFPIWSGTGWVEQTDDTGSHLVTAGHVCHSDDIDAPLSFTAEDRWGKKTQVDVLRISDKYDLCLLGTVVPLGPAMDLSPVEPKYDEEVSMVGAPLGVWGCTSGSTIEECGMAPLSHGHYSGGTLVSLPSTHGFSGSAVFTSFGVIGVLVEGYQGYDSLSFVEPLDHLRDFLSEK